MDGSTLDMIMIPIVVVISMGIWLVMVFYADSHPRGMARSVSRLADPTVIISLPLPERAYQRKAADAAHLRWAAEEDAEHPAA